MTSDLHPNERVRLEAALRDSEERFRLALETAEMSVWDWNVSAPGAFEAGYRSYLRQVHPRDRDYVQSLIVLARAMGGSHEAEFRIIRPDGSVRWMLAKGKAFLGADGLPARMVVALKDVTDRKRAEDEREELVLKLTREHDALSRTEAALRRHRAEQRRLLDAVPAMIWFKDRADRILDCNRAAAATLDLSPEQVVGRLTGELFPKVDTAKYYADDLEVIESGLPKLGIIEEIQTARGERRWLSTDKIPYFDEENRPIGVVVFCVDVTERQRAVEVLRESERLQQEFVANVSHELRTPVAAIKGFAETLRLGGLKDVKNRARFVKIIEAHADRLGSLIENLLFMSAVDAGKIKPQTEALGLAALTADYVSSIEPLTRRRELSVSVSIGEDCVVDGDKEHLMQVLENLFANAIKYNRPRGAIALTARREDDRVRLSLRDSGIGISKADLPRIFDRFFRVEKGASHGNSGLGLHIARRLVQAQGGRLWAESEIGRGSTFHVELPAARAVIKKRREKEAVAMVRAGGGR